MHLVCIYVQQGSEAERQYITWQAARFDKNRHEVARRAGAERRSTPLLALDHHIHLFAYTVTSCPQKMSSTIAR